MVDVVFVLMLFFMASTGSQVVEKELSMNLPAGTAKAGDASKAGEVTPIMIDISSEGAVTVNSTPIGMPDDKDLTQLREWFKATIEQFGDRDPVIVRPFPETQHERIMDVLNAAASAGVTKLTFG